MKSEDQSAAKSKLANSSAAISSEMIRQRFYVRKAAKEAAEVAEGIAAAKVARKRFQTNVLAGIATYDRNKIFLQCTSTSHSLKSVSSKVRKSIPLLENQIRSRLNNGQDQRSFLTISSAIRACASDKRSMPDEISYSTILWKLIQKFHWQAVNDFLDMEKTTIGSNNNYLESCKWKNSKGSTPLHLICSIGSAPLPTVKRVLHGWPRATLLQNKYGDTPLHEECKHSQRSLAKVKLLIDHCPESVSLLNNMGQTPLHVACLAHAMFPVLTQLIQVDPCILLVEDNGGNPPVLLVWRSWRRNIDGMLRIKAVNDSTLLKHDSTVGRFWQKMSFLCERTYSLTHDTSHLQTTSDQATTQTDADGGHSLLLLHAVLNLKICPVDFLLEVLRRIPNLCRVFDKDGNLPLHVLASTHLDCSKRRNNEVWTKMIAAFPDAANTPNKEGRFPLNIAIEHGTADWNNGLSHLFHAAPDVLFTRDVKYDLYPFMLSARFETNWKFSKLEHVNTIYNLLRVQPDVVRYNISL